MASIRVQQPRSRPTLLAKPAQVVSNQVLVVAIRGTPQSPRPAGCPAGQQGQQGAAARGAARSLRMPPLRAGHPTHRLVALLGKGLGGARVALCASEEHQQLALLKVGVTGWGPAWGAAGRGWHLPAQGQPCTFSPHACCALPARPPTRTCAASPARPPPLLLLHLLLSRRRRALPAGLPLLRWGLPAAAAARRHRPGLRRRRRRCAPVVRSAPTAAASPAPGTGGRCSLPAALRR